MSRAEKSFLGNPKKELVHYSQRFCVTVLEGSRALVQTQPDIHLIFPTSSPAKRPTGIYTGTVYTETKRYMYT